jgi:hypothetical protein
MAEPSKVSYMSTREENIRTFGAGVAALAREDCTALSDAALTDRLGQLVPLWELLDNYVTQLANTVIARTFAVSEVAASS